MSQPSFPENTEFTREDVINQIISSIAMEELGLSHIINAEGEKLQYALGTIDGVTGPTQPLTIDELLKLNSSIHKTLDGTMQNQIFLRDKLKTALSASIMEGPTGPTGATGPTGGPTVSIEISGMQVEMRDNLDATINHEEVMVFDSIINQVGEFVEYNTTTGIFTLGRNGHYLVNWWVSVNGAADSSGSCFSLDLNDVSYSTGVLPTTEGHVSGAALISVTNAPEYLKLTNRSNYAINLEDELTQANIVITSMPY